MGSYLKRKQKTFKNQLRLVLFVAGCRVRELRKTIRRIVSWLFLKERALPL
jgi:hypothetical protein